jgi:hypothetical protein
LAPPRGFHAPSLTQDTNMKIRKGRFSGTIGLEVYVDSKHGQVVRSRSRRPWRPTQARLDVQHNLARVVNAWRKLTPKQYQAWAAAARKENMSAYPFFSKINGALAAAKLPLLMDPPKREKLKPNPVGELEILNQCGVITIRLRVPWRPRIKCLCSAPGGAAPVSGRGATDSPSSARCPPPTEVGATSLTCTRRPSACRRWASASSSALGSSSTVGKMISRRPAPTSRPQRSKRVKEVQPVQPWTNTGATLERLHSCKQVAGMLQACCNLL